MANTILQTQPNLPGRLGSPDLILREDPRVDPRLIAAIAPFERDGVAEPAPLSVEASLEARLEFCAASEPGSEEFFETLFADAPGIEGVEKMSESITGVDGNEIKLYLHRPTGADGPLPGILHLHGGGMVILSTGNHLYMRWRDAMAATGLVVVGVEFRNAAGALGPHPFPAGL